MRKRSRYKPRGVNPTAHLMAMMGACRMSANDALLRAERLSLAVDDACRGAADIPTWRVVFDAVNMAEEWSRKGVADGLEAIEELQAIIVAIHERQRTAGTRALYAAEVAALREFAADYAGLVSGVTQQQYMIAQQGVEDRVRRVLSGERIPVSMRVVEAA